MWNDRTITLASHHPLHSSIFRREFQQAHEKNVARHGRSPAGTPEPTPQLIPAALRLALHTRPVIVYAAV